MTKIFLLLTILATSTGVSAQITESVIVRAGEDIGTAISPAGYFRYPQFTEGVLTMKNGSKSRARLNFHIGTGEMQFIDGKGDTLSIAETQNVDNITIGGNTKFIFSDKAYYEIVGESSAGKLGKRIKVQLANVQKGAFGMSDLNGRNRQVSDLMAGQQAVTLSYDVEVKKTTSYYWINNKNTPLQATQKNALKLVANDKRGKLSAFMDDNKINFNHEEDLRKVLAFAATL